MRAESSSFPPNGMISDAASVVDWTISIDDGFCELRPCRFLLITMIIMRATIRTPTPPTMPAIIGVAEEADDASCR